MYNNNTPLNLYSAKLAEQVWSYLVEKMDDDELRKIDNGEAALSEKAYKRIVEFLSGKLINFNNESDKMKQNIKKYNESVVRGNSYFVKTSKTNNFEIGMLSYNVIDASHELGHAFLDINKVTPNRVLWCTISSDYSEYIIDSFCLSFAMPRERFIKIVSKHSKNNSCDIESVANSFDVPYGYAYIRGKELLLWE